jgi:hypothetical protein
MGDQQLRDALRKIQAICNELNSRSQLFRSGKYLSFV